MPLICRKGLPQEGAEFNARIEATGVKVGNSISIQSPSGVRLALGRIIEKLTGQYDREKYVDPRRVEGREMDCHTDMAHDMYRVKVETVFGNKVDYKQEGGTQIETHTFERGWWD